MSKHIKNSAGFSVVEVLVVIVLVAGIAFVAVRVLGAQDTNDANQSVPTASTSEDASSDGAPNVNNNDDLQAVEEFTESVDIDKELDTSELDEVLE